MSEAEIPPELNPHFLEGLRLFDEQRYYEAHDAIEEMWFDEVGKVKRAMQALIQISVGLYHRERGNQRGALKLFRRSAEILEPLPAELLGLDLADVRSRALRMAEEVEGQQQVDEPVYDASLLPDFRAARQELTRRRQDLNLPDQQEGTV